VSLAYRMQESSREEMAAADPFEGRGVFLASPGSGKAEMLARLATLLDATVPAVAWDAIGVWVDPGSIGIDTVALLGRWNGGKASEHW
jgi:hypothetical protein